MVRPLPLPSATHPASWSDFLRWLLDDPACLDDLDWLRWPDGFVCPHCQATKGWRLPDGRWSCGACSRPVSATAGTIFHATRTPLTIWFTAAWHMTSQKNGSSALGLRRVLGIGSHQTAWAMLHRFRTTMIRPGRDRLSGQVEVDETYLGGPEPGRGGRGALGKTLVAVAVERVGVRLDRCRLAVINNREGPFPLPAYLCRSAPPACDAVLKEHRRYFPIWPHSEVPLTPAQPSRRRLFA